MNKHQEKQSFLDNLQFKRMTWRVFGDEAMIRAALDLSRVPVNMNDPLTTSEAQAVDIAAEAVGDYLVQIEKTDFIDMNPDEHAEFFRVFVLAYRRELRRIIAEQPPF